MPAASQTEDDRAGTGRGHHADRRQTCDADDVARLTADAVVANRLYILPHRASRDSIRRRFERIDRTFDEQAAEGWSH